MDAATAAALKPFVEEAAGDTPGNDEAVESPYGGGWEGFSMEDVLEDYSDDGELLGGAGSICLSHEVHLAAIQEKPDLLQDSTVAQDFDGRAEEFEETEVSVAGAGEAVADAGAEADAEAATPSRARGRGKGKGGGKGGHRHLNPHGPEAKRPKAAARKAARKQQGEGVTGEAVGAVGAEADAEAAELHTRQPVDLLSTVLGGEGDDAWSSGMQSSVPELQLVTLSWEEALGRQDIEIDSNFFEIGGHSVYAMKLASDLSRKFKVQISVQHIHENPTIKQLAARIQSLVSAEASTKAVTLRFSNHPPSLFYPK